MRLRGYNIAGGQAQTGLTAPQLALLPTAALPVPAGNANKYLRVNSGASGYEGILVPDGRVDGDSLIWTGSAWQRSMVAAFGYGNSLPSGMFTETPGAGGVSSYIMSNGLITCTHALTAGVFEDTYDWIVPITPEMLPLEIFIWIKLTMGSVNHSGQRNVSVWIELINQANTTVCGTTSWRDQGGGTISVHHASPYYTGQHYDSGVWLHARIGRSGIWVRQNNETSGDTRWSCSDNFSDLGQYIHADPTGSSASYTLRLRSRGYGEDTATTYIKHYMAKSIGASGGYILSK